MRWRNPASTLGDSFRRLGANLRARFRMRRRKRHPLLARVLLTIALSPAVAFILAHKIWPIGIPGSLLNPGSQSSVSSRSDDNAARNQETERGQTSNNGALNNKMWNTATFAQVVVDSDGRPLRAFADHQGIWRYSVTLDQVSPYYLEALIHYEDKWFWRHPGINPMALLRAAYLNIRYGRIISGGSTISMQVARLLYPHSRTMKGKIYQIFRTLQLEWTLSKRDILTIYCNIAPFGGTIEGVQAASFTYLDKPAQHLSHAEAALLAVLPQSPTRNRPDLNNQTAERARNKVLQRLVDLGVWSQETVEQAMVEPVLKQKIEPPLNAPLLSERLSRKHSTTPADDSAQRPVINTTIDGDLQRSLEDYLKQTINNFPTGTSAALLVVDNATANVKAYIGAADFGHRERFGHVDMVQAIRSPGSTLKPFLYARAMDRGLIHSQSLLADVPRRWGDYRPANFGGAFVGPVSASEALQRSLNTPVIELLQRYGAHTFAGELNNAGIKLNIPGGNANLSIILGGAGTNLEKLVTGYMAFANEGKTRPLVYTKTTKDEESEIAVEQDEHYFFSPEAAWIVHNILTEIPPPGALRHSLSQTQRAKLAWKTGTSYGFRDSWAIGVNGRITIGVWMGRPDGTPLAGNTGRENAGAILHTVADYVGSFATSFASDETPLSSTHEKLSPPAGVESRPICWPLGTLASDQSPEHCHQRRQAWLIKGSVPPTWHAADQKNWQPSLVNINVDKQSRGRVVAGCQGENTELQKIALWPSVLDPWLPEHLQRHRVLPDVDPKCKHLLRPPLAKLRIAGIHDNSAYLASDYRSKDKSNDKPNARKNKNTVNSKGKPAELKLSATGGEGQLHWYINGKYHYSAKHWESILHRLDDIPKQQVTVIDDNGNSDSVSLRVIYR